MFLPTIAEAWRTADRSAWYVHLYLIDPNGSIGAMGTRRVPATA